MSANSNFDSIADLTVEQDSFDGTSSANRGDEHCNNLHFASVAAQKIWKVRGRLIYRRFVPGLLAVVGVSAPFMAVTVWANANYGSLGAAIAAYRGEALYVDSVEKYAEPIRVPAASASTFRLTNLKSSPITILGARRTCGCLSVKGLPVTMQPAETVEIELDIQPSSNDIGQQVTQSATLYLDANCRRPTLTLHASFY